MSEVVPDFRFDPDAGAYLASFGPKGSGKSELNKRLFVSYPYDGLLVDHTGDADPGYRWTEPLPPALEAIAARVVVEKGGEIPNQPGLEAEIAAAWQGEKPGPHKYRHEPNYLADDWLERSDRVIGLAYLHGRCDIFLDEIDDAAPTNQTPRFTRLTLRMGRHRAISLGMAGPRPIGVDPLVLSQPDVVTIHGPLHERDLARLAAQFHMSTAELGRLIQELEPFGYLAFFKAEREIQVRPALPPPERRPLPLPAEPESAPVSA